MYTLELPTPEKMCSCEVAGIGKARVQRGSGRAWASGSVKKALPRGTHVKGDSPVARACFAKSLRTHVRSFSGRDAFFFFETQKVQTLMCQPRSVVIAREQAV